MNDKPVRRSTCPINASLEVLGDRWSLLIVRDMIFGGAKTYRDFLASEEGIATNVLADRLMRLQKAGVLTATRDPKDKRSQIYRLTAKGIDLLPVVMELSRWGSLYEDGQAPRGTLEEWTEDREKFVAELRAKLVGSS